MYSYEVINYRIQINNALQTLPAYILQELATNIRCQVLRSIQVDFMQVYKGHRIILKIAGNPN